MSRWSLRVLVPAFFIIGCRAGERQPADGARGAADPEPPAAPAGERRVVLFVGTSLTAALGLEPEQGFPALIQEKIDSAGLPFEVVNAGVSGETSTGARGRMRWLLNQPFDVLVLETGANDMLRGTSLRRLRENLEAIVDTVKEARPGARIVLAGMVAAPNLGERYGRDFRAVYADVAREDTLPLVPFLLEGVAGNPELNLGDGIHPNERGHRILAENVWRVLEPVLRAEASAPPRE
ncbi:MAG TPA: arylesterase [Longimicrobium sp.]